MIIRAVALCLLTFIAVSGLRPKVQAWMPASLQVAHADASRDSKHGGSISKESPRRAILCGHPGRDNICLNLLMLMQSSVHSNIGV